MKIFLVSFAVGQLPARFARRRSVVVATLLQVWLVVASLLPANKCLRRLLYLLKNGLKIANEYFIEESAASALENILEVVTQKFYKSEF